MNIACTVREGALVRHKTKLAHTLDDLLRHLERRDGAEAREEIGRLRRCLFGDDLEMLDRCACFLRDGLMGDAESLVYQASFRRQDADVRSVYSQTPKAGSLL